MARIPARRSTAAEKAQLAEAIARAAHRLRQLEAQQRREAKAAYQAQLLAAGKVVEACGLLGLEAGELEIVLKRGIEALPAVAGYLACASPPAQTSSKLQ